MGRPGVEGVIIFHRVSKIYSNGVKALQNVSLTIEPGEFVFIVGPTGAGKSTLLRLIYREELPSRGKVLIGSKDVTRLSPRLIPYLRRSIGVVFQDFKLLPQKTAWENVAFALYVTGTPEEEIPRRVGRSLSLVGLLDKAMSFPHQLSGGEQQRVSIARALVHEPPILLADEPTGNLDPATSWEIIQLLSVINRRGTTVVVTTHNKLIVDMLRRRVIELSNGVVVRDQPSGYYAHEV